MTELRVRLAGEGPNELGRDAVDPSRAEPGVIEALLRKVQPTGWSVTGRTKWKDIGRYRAKGPTPGEADKVLALAFDAQRAEQQILAFARDSDGKMGRVAEIRRGVDEARSAFPHVAIVGGAPHPVLEAWLLALQGKTGTETLSKAGAQSRLTETGVPSKDTAAMVAAVEAASVDAVPRDAEGLRTWLEDAKVALTTLV